MLRIGCNGYFSKLMIPNVHLGQQRNNTMVICGYTAHPVKHFSSEEGVHMLKLKKKKIRRRRRKEICILC